LIDALTEEMRTEMQTRTTFNLNISRPALLLAKVRSWLAQRDPIALVAPLALALLALIIALGIVWQLHQARQTVPTPTPAIATPGLIVVLETARAAQLPTTTPRLITAYDQPNGNAFPDPIPEPPASAWEARWGDDWIAVRWQPYAVWVRASDLGASLIDVRPVPQLPTLAPAIAAPKMAPQYQTDSAPELGEAPQLSPAEQQADQVYRAQIGLSDADMDQALRDHQAQQAASCAAGRITNATYCAAVQQWMEEHQ
jgi:hypothetical protein